MTASKSLHTRRTISTWLALCAAPALAAKPAAKPAAQPVVLKLKIYWDERLQSTPQHAIVSGRRWLLNFYTDANNPRKRDWQLDVLPTDHKDGSATLAIQLKRGTEVLAQPILMLATGQSTTLNNTVRFDGRQNELRIELALAAA